jgi:hypothetical protein
MDTAVWIVAIVCYTLYKIFELKRCPRPYEELKALNELREKGVITQQEFDAKKSELLG